MKFIAFFLFIVCGFFICHIVDRQRKEMNNNDANNN